MITIHCGLHKTGSSSIQLALELCSKRGRTIVTPKPGDDRSERGWRDRLTRLARAESAVFSDENLLGSPFDGYASAPQRLSILRHALAGQPFQLLVYLRPQIDWLPSVYLQGVQEGRTLSPIEFWDQVSESPYLRWSQLVELLRLESGAVSVAVRGYLRSRDVVADFFAAADLGPVPRVGSASFRENVSIAASQAPLLIALGKRPDVTPKEREILRETFQGLLAPGAARSLSPFQVSLQSQICRSFAEDWESLTHYFVDDPEERTMFLAESHRWTDQLVAFAGEGMDAIAVQSEAIRSIQVLCTNQVSRSTKISRVFAKLRNDPIGALSAAFRRLRRRTMFTP